MKCHSALEEKVTALVRDLAQGLRMGRIIPLLGQSVWVEGGI